MSKSEQELKTKLYVTLTELNSVLAEMKNAGLYAEIFSINRQTICDPESIESFHIQKVYKVL